MKKLRHLIIFCVLLITCPVFGSDFETDFWPGEGIPGFSAKNSSLSLYSLPTATSTQIQYKLRKGAKFLFDASKLITKQSVTLFAKVEVTDVHCKNSTGLKKAIMPGGAEGFSQQRTVIMQGETVEYLQYRAEGYITARYKGNICEVFVMDNVPKFEGIEKQPVVEWWIRVVDGNKIPQGWLLVDKSQVNFLKRSF